jgi:anaerobic ribonucleoside-triphosphate reductase
VDRIIDKMFNKNCEGCGKYLEFPIDDFEHITKPDKVCEYFDFDGKGIPTMLCPKCNHCNVEMGSLKETTDWM